MTAAEFRAALDRLALTQVAAAELFGVTHGTVNRWARGARTVHPCAARLLAVMDGGMSLAFTNPGLSIHSTRGGWKVWR